ncbi:MAG: MBL fold metallo-hydrolase [Pseudomonadota bacterium]
MSDVVILDVAHGNCALVRSTGAHCVIDAPTGALLLNTLEDLGVSCVEVAFISHADKDHIAGIIGLLSSKTIKLKRLFLNPDSQKQTKIWRHLLAAVKVAERHGSCEVITSLTTTMPGQVSIGEVSVHVEAPSASFALAGSGSKDAKGRSITSNSISAVLRLKFGDRPSVLLTGDLDEIGLDDAIEHDSDLSAETMVFPHHGGLPNSSDTSAFVNKIMDAVAPGMVIFSNGREMHNNPRSEVLQPVLKMGCGIACTQLAKRCHKTPLFGDAHLEVHRAQGQLSGASCGGSMTIELANSARRIVSAHNAHQAFIDENVAAPMCRASRQTRDGT